MANNRLMSNNQLREISTWSINIIQNYRVEWKNSVFMLVAIGKLA